MTMKIVEAPTMQEETREIELADQLTLARMEVRVLRTMLEGRQHKDNIDAATQQLSSFIRTLHEKNGADAKEWAVDLEKGKFVKKG